MKIKTGRVFVAAFGVPAFAAGMGWLLRHVWAPRLPDTVAIHWDVSGADGGVSLNTITGWTLGASVALAVAFAALVLVGLRYGHGMRRTVVAFAAGLATMPAACLIASLWATLDVPSWEQAAGPAEPIAIVLGLSAIAGLLGTLAAGPGVPPEWHADAASAGPSLGLASGERATWLGGATNVTAVFLLMLVLPALMLAAGLLTGGALSWTAYLTVAAVSVLVALATARVRAVVDSTGVTIRIGAFGRPRRHIPLLDIAGADVEQLGLLSAGGFGVRVNLVSGYTAYKIRSGPALAIELRSGHRVLVTVDRPEQAAGLVNDLVQRETTDWVR